MQTAAHTVRYSTDVIQIGALVEQFLQAGMLVLFAEGAPQELHEFCALHRPAVVVGGVAAGDLLRIDDEEVVITAVGHLANDNLRQLGHISVKANGMDTAPLPGDVCVGASVLPELRTGSRLEIVSVLEIEGR